MKKNNPGCNCCQEMLLWDVGYSDVRDFDGSGTGNYFFWGPGAINSALEEISVEVHRPIPREILYAPAPLSSLNARDFYQRTGSWDPYQDPPQDAGKEWDDFWTRSIFDYKTVIYPHPMSSTENTGDDGPCCGDGVTAPICGTAAHATMYLDTDPDHQFSDFPPLWWDDVVSGPWEGRLVIYSFVAARQFFAQPGYHTQLGVLDNHNLGMNISLVEGIEFVRSDYEVQPLGASDLTEGVASPSQDSLPADITGGEAVMIAGTVNYRNPWCDLALGGPAVRYDRTAKCIARNRTSVVIDEVTYHKDFVLVTAGGAIGVGADHAQFWRNLYEAPIQATPDSQPA